MSAIPNVQELQLDTWQFNTDVPDDMGIYTELRNELPVTRMKLSYGVNMVSFPFNLGVDRTIEDVIPASVGAKLSIYRIQEGAEGVGTSSTISYDEVAGWEWDTPAFELQYGMGYEVIVTLNSGFTDHEPDATTGGYLYWYASPYHTTQQINGSGWSLIDYPCFGRQSIHDAWDGTVFATNNINKIKDGDGRQSNYVNGEWMGDMDQFEFGKAYWIYKTTVGDVDVKLFQDPRDEKHHYSHLQLPTYINDKPRLYSEDPDNWLYGKEYGDIDGLGDKSHCNTFHWDRAYNWRGQYIIGHRIRFVNYDSEHQKYVYQPLPAGDDDWIISINSQHNSVPKVYGYQRQNDVKPSKLLYSDTEIDINDWDPYNNEDHMELLGNPEKTTDPENYGKQIMASAKVFTNSGYRDVDWFHNSGETEELSLIFYDSIMKKFYWLKETSVADVPVLKDNTYTSYNQVTVWHNVLEDQGAFSYDAEPRALRPVKGPYNIINNF